MLKKYMIIKSRGMATIINKLVKEFYKQKIIVTYQGKNNNKIGRS